VYVLRHLRPPCVLALEDGRVFTGRSIGAPGERAGEVVFNTGLTGYQEILTDPSYKGQIVTMTSPLIGNYGTNEEDPESDSPKVEGFVVREASRIASNWRSAAPLPELLEKHGVVAAEDIDTRALTLHIREKGAMRAVISTEDADGKGLIEKARASPAMGRPQPGERGDVRGTVRLAGEASLRGRSGALEGHCLRLRREAKHPQGACPSRLPRAGRPRLNGCGRGPRIAARRRRLLERPRRSRARGNRHPRGARDHREGPGLRHMPRPPDHGAGARREDVQAQVRPSRVEPPGEGPRYRPHRDHRAEPRLLRGCREPRGSRREDHSPEPER